MGGLLALYGEVVLQVGVVLGLLWGVWATIRRVHRDPRAGLALRIGVVISGLVAGVGLSFVRYMPDADTVVYGVPLPLAVFQRHDGQWLDYVGSSLAMLVIAALNVAVVVFLTHSVAWAVLALRGRISSGSTSRAGTGEAA
jgi:hypothetical protein